MIKFWEGVKMRIAILGFGTVGSGVYEIAKTLKNIEVKKVLEKNGEFLFRTEGEKPKRNIHW